MYLLGTFTFLKDNFYFGLNQNIDAAWVQTEKDTCSFLGKIILDLNPFPNPRIGIILFYNPGRIAYCNGEGRN